jgi:hypothetical protein
MKGPVQPYLDFVQPHGRIPLVRVLDRRTQMTDQVFAERVEQIYVCGTVRRSA